jgi:hypothetical protein
MMGWHIGLIENTVVVPSEFAQQLFEACEYEEHWYSVEEVLDGNGHLTFNPDNMEHMDYLWDKDVQKVLVESKVNGRIVFASVEGDNRGTWWSHTFVDGICENKGGKIADLIPA